MQYHGTTVLALIHNGKAAIAADGQVTFDDVVAKSKANKIRKLQDGKILAGFAGAAADALTLFELFEKKIDQFPSNLAKASVELAKDWRTDKTLQKLEAVIAVATDQNIFLISGNGDVLEPDDGIVAIGSGGSYALAAARALIFSNPKLTADKIAAKALEIAADICIYTNKNITVETIK